MDTSKDQSQVHPQTGPIAQKLANIQSSRHQGEPRSNNKQASEKKPQKRKPNWLGFSGKTFWDWLQLLGVFLIPVVITAASIWFSTQQSTTNLQLSQRQHESDQKIAADNRQADVVRQEDQQRESALNTYMDNIKDLLLNRGLRLSKPGDEVRIVARAETLSVLGQLDGERKGMVVQFLSEAGLITGTGKDVFIDLRGADLRSVSLRSASLRGAHLSGADLSRADLSLADLSGAHLLNDRLNDTILTSANLINADLYKSDLSGAVLIGADLNGADLTSSDLDFADLSEAIITVDQITSSTSHSDTILPDGSTNS